jgi:oligoendopeptidase F
VSTLAHELGHTMQSYYSNKTQPYPLADYSIELLKNAGVDMTSSEPFDKAIEAMNDVMDQIEEILNKKGL